MGTEGSQRTVSQTHRILQHQHNVAVCQIKQLVQGTRLFAWFICGVT